MELLPKAFLLPIDDTEESLRPIRFLTRLYPDRSHISLTLHYLTPPLPPVYKEKNRTDAQIAQKKAFVAAREEAARKACARAKKVLVDSGFTEEVIHEFVQEKELSVAHHACRLADIKRVDAVVLQKQTSSRLEGFLKGDHTSALLHHCLISPIWFVDDEVDPSKALVLLADNDPSLRALDHALFMLEETPTQMEIVHFSKKASQPLTSPLDPLEPSLERWIRTSGTGYATFFQKAQVMALDAQVAPDRIRICVQPSRGKLPAEILAYARQAGAGILVLGHGGSGGTWGFLKSSLTKKILTDFRHQAVWVNQ
ncbi:Nucleotide-binding universal stress protein, UspA family [Desulfacinum hydrothermale DSM 13146]|uniref:Nucleotide-binding universal stress protein, UspA family n=1 Tax=Desulfacinum hydrothermale DSM 13146 TaxID=1121390 RepID=A0A1W1X8X7_9BACT|nr:universal stress protein [Desulfacinum hydrothermale]SMC20435.1 Nucleotide-binding universal stress protein, UspA family [Desulfacinum hydrothermale DSM 13146]